MGTRRLEFTLLAGAVLAVLVLQGHTPRAVGGGQTDSNRYIIALRHSSDARDVAAIAGLTPLVSLDALKGFVADVPTERVAAVRSDPRVLSIERDSLMRAAIHENPFQTLPTGVDRAEVDAYPGAGIGGVAGPDVNGDVAVIDSGIDIDHPDLNVAGGIRFTGAGCGGGSHDDDYLHGTHVAGIIGAKDDNKGVVGVAPGARLWAVKVLDSTGTGFTSCVVSGFDWVTERRREYNDGPADGDPGTNILVINASLGGPTSQALCTAVNNAVAQGILVATAAGNGTEDASESGPGNCLKGVTVSAFADFDGIPGGLTDQTVSYNNCTETEDDSFACFSNHGPVVDLAAPGAEIVSTVPDGLYAWAGGTSMAAPHVAGALLLYRLQGGYNQAADGPIVTSSLVSYGWTQSQGSTCGFAGDPDSIREPMLFLGTNCFGDRDGDGTIDQADNCPDWANPLQELPTWVVPAGDSDCDGFTRGHESYGSNLASRRCAATTIPNDEAYDSWPTDNDDNGSTNLPDVIRMASSYNAYSGDPNYEKRYDINADGGVNLADIIRFGPFFNKTC